MVVRAAGGGCGALQESCPAVGVGSNREGKEKYVLKGVVKSTTDFRAGKQAAAQSSTGFVVVPL